MRNHPHNNNNNNNNSSSSSSSGRRLWQSLSASLVAVLLFLVTLLTSSSRRSSRDPRQIPQHTPEAEDSGDAFLSFLRQFVSRGGLRNVFPGDDSRDSSVQFELISQVNCTTSVGREISVNVRNTPTSSRRMRMFGGL